MIKLTNVYKQISHKQVLININLELNEGNCILVRGHNGSGKTMLLRLICGLIQPTSGTVTYDRDYRYGVIIENPTFFQQESALYNLRYLASINKIISEETIKEYLGKLDLLAVKDTKVKTFSLGMKQRLALCQAFMENPDVLLLDEPFNAVDDKNMDVIYSVIRDSRNQGKIIVIAAHGEVTNRIDYDYIIEMNQGEIAKQLSLER